MNTHQDIERLYKTFGQSVFQRAYRSLRDKEEAMDLTQDIFHNLLKVPTKLSDPEDSHRYLHRATTNAITKFWLKKNRRLEIHNLLFQEESYWSQKTQINTQENVRMDLERVKRELHEKDWELLYYRHYAEYSTKDIAEILSLSERGVRKRLEKLQGKLHTLRKGWEK